MEERTERHNMSTTNNTETAAHNPAPKRKSSKSQPPSMRIVLLGKSVSENSRVGNLILGRSAFDSEAPPDVVERVGGRLKDRHVTLINSPQLLHTNISDDQITQTVIECVSLSAPGPHVVLLLLQHQQCSAEDQERVEKLQDSFSERLLQHTLVLSTQEPTEPNQILQKIIQKCSNRHFSLQGSSSADHLLQAFEDIEQSNEGRHLISAAPSGDSQCSTVEKQDTQTHCERLNVLVCGSGGSLKSSISELILQHTHRRSESVRTDADLHGRLINVLELPDLFNTGLSEEEVMRQSLRCVSRCHPGVHAFLLIIPDAPLNNEDRAEMEEIQKIFSSRINKHIMILIMQNSEHQTAELNEETQAVIQSFGGRHHYFCPKTQVSTLMENIEQMLEENRGGVYSTETFLEAQMIKLMKYEEMKIKKINLLETPLLTEEIRVNTDDEVRIVLLGKTGVGKSTTGNTILGRKAFTSEPSHQPVTKESQRESCEINGRQVIVVDTPGVFDTELTEEEIQREIRHCISMILPGPHVFLLLIPLGRFTKEEETSVKIIQETFGENSLMFTVVLFTRGDSLGNKSIEEFLGKPGSPLMNLIETCGNRVHVFNNNQPEDRTQVSNLLEKIDNMVKVNGGSFYSCKMFREMEREKQEQQMKILMDRVRETEEEMKKLQEEKERMEMMMEEERQNQEKERKRREEEFREREERYKRLIKEREQKENELLEQMKLERLQKQKPEERLRRREEEKQKSELLLKPVRDRTMAGEEMLEPNPLRRTRSEHIEPVSRVSGLPSRRIVLLGKCGAGKSASGNTILGRSEFRSEMSIYSVTRKCSAAEATVSGRSVSVVDTPGLYHTQMKPEELMMEIARSVYISSPGPHAFLIVFPEYMGFNKHELGIPQMIEKMFGEEVLKYSIILFTHGDLLDGESVEELIEESRRLRSLVQQCGGRYHVFNNRDEDNREQVEDLLQKIDSMIQQNGGAHYTNQMYENAQRFRREEEEERQIQEEIERVRKESEERVRSEDQWRKQEKKQSQECVCS